MRLILLSAAYWLMRTLRDTIPKPQPLASSEFSTIRQRLLKIAVRVKDTASRLDRHLLLTVRMRICSATWLARTACVRHKQRGRCPVRPLLSNPWCLTNMG
jgi:hypothetical protein